MLIISRVMESYEKVVGVLSEGCMWPITLGSELDPRVGQRGSVRERVVARVRWGIGVRGRRKRDSVGEDASGQPRLGLELITDSELVGIGAPRYSR